TASPTSAPQQQTQRRTHTAQQASRLDTAQPIRSDIRNLGSTTIITGSTASEPHAPALTLIRT
ncbi:hypothetical protein AB0J72_41975, partial [Dactylosporangium sp. NPDC049742]|uniref:hypothetical protein n=1 Tax=Dactylosporangium sp. NPDC049742 TaxID=3154737 RepID=UPI00343862D7